MFIQELQAKMSASSGVIHVREDDEVRLETKCQQVASNAGYNFLRWTYSEGIQPIAGCEYNDLQVKELAGIMDPQKLLLKIKEWDAGPSLILAFDFFTMANRLPSLPMIARLLKDITLGQQMIEGDGAVVQLIICDQADPELPVSLQKLALELPDRKEMGAILDAILETLPATTTQASHDREKLLNALAGLPAYQASNAISESVSRTNRVDADVIRSFKKELVSAQGITWIDPDPRGFDALGGLEPVKAWARKRVVAFDEERRARYGVRPPKGLVAGGKPGCAKSAFARALASEWGMVLLRLDVGATRGMYQGQSDQSFTSAILVAEAIAPCILWVDEVEKAFSGVGAGGATDGGTGERVFGSFLTWMQEKTAQVFVYLAGNRMDLLPPEFTRAGRFDATMWFDIPTTAERQSIAEVFRTRYPKAGNVDTNAIVAASENCTGAEIEACFEEAALTAMLEERDMTTKDVTDELKNVTKVNDTFAMSEGLTKWRDAAIKANADNTTTATPTPLSQRVRRIGRK